MTTEELFRYALVRLAQREAALRTDELRRSGRVRNCFDLLLGAQPPFIPTDESRLEGYLKAEPDNGDTSYTGGLIFLPVPSNRRRLALLNAIYDFSGTNPIASLQVGFFVVGA